MSAMIGNPLLLPDEGYNISRSVRLRSSASAYFNRTFTSPTNRDRWTWSAWVKRGELSAAGTLFASASSNSNWLAYFSTTDTLLFQTAATTRLQTTQVFRDPSAWYHLVVVYDAANATAALRTRFYVNGVEPTSYANDFRSGITTSQAEFNTAVSHFMGSGNGTFDGYLTEINFIDGQALTPSSFGETDSITGVWKPKKYTGTYGTNGFFLNFSDNSNNTAATIGKDYSGNGNNWTPNNISVTSGSTYDSMLDVPTQWADGGNGRGNYAVLNPLSTATYFPTAGNLNYSWQSGANTWGTAVGSVFVSSGKHYFETTVTNASTFSGANVVAGVVDASFVPATSGYAGATANSYGWQGIANRYNAGTGSSYGTAASSGDVVMIALDVDAGKVWFGRNGTWFASGDPATGANASYSGLAALAYTFAVSSYSPSGNYGIHNANFGQRPFSYTPPSGFKALNTLNLPAPTILKGNQYFDVVTRNGFGASGGSISSLQFQPDFNWSKARNAVSDHNLVDSVRGVSKFLSSNTTGAEGTSTTYLTAFNSNGYSLGSGDYATTTTVVDWLWKEGATQGFDILTYTGTGSNTTVAHSLGVAPRMMIVKRRNSTGDWLVWHRNVADTGSDRVLFLNSTDAQTAASTNFNSTFPTSSVFSVGTNAATNASGGTYVAYLFSEVAGFSRFGSYTGNGSTDGPFVFCGFRPRFFMWKRTDTTANWLILDTSRDLYNLSGNQLFPNLSNAEFAGSIGDIISNGFKFRDSGASNNASGGTYIFAAFAEHPFKNALAR